MSVVVIASVNTLARTETGDLLRAAEKRSIPGAKSEAALVPASWVC